MGSDSWQAMDGMLKKNLFIQQAMGTDGAFGAVNNVITVQACLLNKSKPGP